MSRVRQGAPAVAEERTLPDLGSSFGFHSKGLFVAPLGRLDIRPQQSIEKGMTAGVELPGSQHLLLFLFFWSCRQRRRMEATMSSCCSSDLFRLRAAASPSFATGLQIAPCRRSQPFLMSVGTKPTTTWTPRRENKHGEPKEINVRTLDITEMANGCVACQPTYSCKQVW